MQQRVILFVVAALLLAFGLSAANAADQLAPRYRQWLERDVAYIITREERDVFLKLASDEARDKFIDRFWEIRNPTPGAPTNPYKEEHYRRIEYANQYFGKEEGAEGWRTDRGKIYIELGPPQQKALHLSNQNLRPFEIWFYSSTHPALPPFFYVLFYQRENIGDFRLYSPYFDGPEKLVTTLHTVNSRSQSLQVVEKAAGREVARITLSLLPDEPVNLTEATSSLQSDVLVSTLKNLANHPLIKADLNRRRQILESVSSRVIFGGEFLNVIAVPLRDPDGNTHLHYVLRANKPEDFAVGEAKDSRYYYSVAVMTRVFGPDDKRIFTEEKKLSRYFDRKQLEEVKNKVFGVAGSLPLAPGKYRVEFQLTNQINQTAFRAEKDVTIPAPPAQGILLTPVVAFSEAEAVNPSKANLIPFSVAGVRFSPLAGQQTLVPGEELKVFYQIWVPPGDSRASQNKQLVVEYAYGRPGVPGGAKTIREEVSKDQFDAAGSLISGKKIPTLDLPAGSYLLTVNVTDTETQQKVYGTLGFRVWDKPSSIASWDVYDENLAEDVGKGVPDYQRGLCYLALNQKDKAIEWFRKTLQKNPADEEARARLVDLYFARESFREVAELYGRGGITNQTSDQTILRMAEGFDKIGNTQKAVEILESALSVKTPSGPLYLALASYYQRLGNVQKAAEMERKGKSLMAAASSS